MGGKNIKETKKKEINPSINDFEIIDYLWDSFNLNYKKYLLCKYSKDNKYYMIKAFNKEYIKKMDYIDNINKERNIMTNTKSPFILGIKMFFHDNLNIYMISELYLGGDLNQYIFNNSERDRRRTM